MEKVKLFCLPYAGGHSARIYSTWKKLLHTNIEIYPVELSGRGKRIAQPHYKNFEDAIEDVYKLITQEIEIDDNYALFGHSMGGLLAYELTHLLIERGYRQPLHIFVSGRRAPHILRGYNKKLHILSDNEFIDEILKLNGTPKEIFENKELAALYIPILKSDYRIIENYHNKTKNKFKIPMTSFGGNEDDIAEDDIAGWREHTNHKFNYHMFDGGHFFLHNKEREITEIINRELAG